MNGWKLKLFIVRFCLKTLPCQPDGECGLEKQKNDVEDEAVEPLDDAGTSETFEERKNLKNVVMPFPGK